MARVLVADGDRNMRGVVKLVLVSAGYEVSESADAQDALEKSRTDPPDLILWGITIADSDLADARKLLSEDPATSNIPVVFLSEEEAVQGLQAEDQDFVSKPFTAGQLESKVRSAISNGNPAKGVNDQEPKTSTDNAPPRDPTQPKPNDTVKAGVSAQPSILGGSALGGPTRNSPTTTTEAPSESRNDFRRFFPSSRIAIAALIPLFGVIVFLAPVAYPIRSAVFGEADLSSLDDRLPTVGEKDVEGGQMHLDPWVDCIADSFEDLRERIRAGTLNPQVENADAIISPAEIRC